MQAAAFPGDTAAGGDGSADAGRGLGVLKRLRSATAPAHRRVEARMFPSALDDLGSYRRMLAVLLALHEPLEQAFPSVPGFADLGIDLGERRKAHLLREDLTHLDAHPDVPAPRPAPLPRRTDPTPLTSLPAALGAFYVLEGSTLGGRFLLTEVRERLHGAPTRFLAGYGDGTGRMWKQTRTVLVRGVLEAPDPSEAERALVAGADTAFGRLDALLDQVGWGGPLDGADG